MTRSPHSLRVHDVVLEDGHVIPAVDVGYFLDGELSPTRDNVILIHHALTGTADAANDWWRDIIGPGKAIDTRRWAVLATNLLGSCYGTRPVEAGVLPPITTRDQAIVAQRVIDALGIPQVALVCGGSLGGMVAMESIASFPDRFDAAVIFAAPGRQTALGEAWGACMRRALDVGGDALGLALARMIGMVSYRTSASLERKRHAGIPDSNAREVEAWLAMHGDKLVARFDAAAYRALIDAMDRHDVARGRSPHLLQSIAPRLTMVGIPGDLLYPADDVWAWATTHGAATAAIRSIHGHDAFLLEQEQVGDLLRTSLERVTAQRSATDA